MNRFFLQGEKVQVSRLLEVLGSRTGIPKGPKKISGGEGGLVILKGRAWGG